MAESLDVVTVFLVSVMATVFAVASIGKAATRNRFGDFADSLSQFGVRQWTAQRGVAALVVTLEWTIVITMACALLLDIPAAVWVTAMLGVTVFIGALSAALVRADRVLPEVRCHCFGTTDSTDVSGHLAGNSLLVLTTLALAVLGEPTAVDPGLGTFAAGVGVLAAMAILFSRDIAQALSTSAL